MYRSPHVLLLGLLLRLCPTGKLVLSVGPGLAQGVKLQKVEVDRLFKGGNYLPGTDRTKNFYHY